MLDTPISRSKLSHRHTAVRSPTTTGKIERFHRTLRLEFDTRRTFRSLAAAQDALDEWVTYYNTQRAHQALAELTRPAGSAQES